MGDQINHVDDSCGELRYARLVEGGLEVILTALQFQLILGLPSYVSKAIFSLAKLFQSPILLHLAFLYCINQVILFVINFQQLPLKSIYIVQSTANLANSKRLRKRWINKNVR